MTDIIENKRVTGIILMVLGVSFYAFQHYGGHHTIPIFLVGGAFLAAYFYKKIYGLLIPGCIITGVGLGILFDQSFFVAGNSILIFLGLGFAAIYLIATVCEGHTHWWPIIPAMVLIAVGVFVEYGYLLSYLGKCWPLIFLVSGLLLIYSSFQDRPTENNQSQ